MSDKILCLKMDNLKGEGYLVDVLYGCFDAFHFGGIFLRSRFGKELIIRKT